MPKSGIHPETKLVKYVILDSSGKQSAIEIRSCLKVSEKISDTSPFAHSAWMATTGVVIDAGSASVKKFESDYGDDIFA